MFDTAAVRIVIGLAIGTRVVTTTAVHIVVNCMRSFVGGVDGEKKNSTVVPRFGRFRNYQLPVHD